MKRKKIGWIEIAPGIRVSPARYQQLQDDQLNEEQRKEIEARKKRKTLAIESGGEVNPRSHRRDK